MRFSRKQKKELIGRFSREVYRKLIGEELILHNGFPYTKPNQNQRMYPYNFGRLLLENELKDLCEPGMKSLNDIKHVEERGGEILRELIDDDILKTLIELGDKTTL